MLQDSDKAEDKIEWGYETRLDVEWWLKIGWHVYRTLFYWFLYCLKKICFMEVQWTYKIVKYVYIVNDSPICFINTSITSHIYLCVCVLAGWWWKLQFYSLGKFNYAIQCYQLQSPCFMLKPQNLFILYLKVHTYLPTSPWFPHPPATFLFCFNEFDLKKKDSMWSEIIFVFLCLAYFT